MAVSLTGSVMDSNEDLFRASDHDCFGIDDLGIDSPKDILEGELPYTFGSERERCPTPPTPEETWMSVTVSLVGAIPGIPNLLLRGRPGWQGHR